MVPFPFVLFVSVIFETSGLVVVESQPMFGFELYCLGRLSGCSFIFYINCEAMAAILEDGLAGTC